MLAPMAREHATYYMLAQRCEQTSMQRRFEVAPPTAADVVNERVWQKKSRNVTLYNVYRGNMCLTYGSESMHYSRTDWSTVNISKSLNWKEFSRQHCI